MNSRVFRAVVSKVVYPTDSGAGQLLIFVSPYITDSAVNSEFPASPPSPLPIDSFGGGMLSCPQVGQECLVCILEGLYHILTYLTPRFAPNGGVLLQSQFEEGSVVLTTQDLERGSFSLSRGGRMEFISNMFSQFAVSGTDQSIFHKSMAYTNEFAGGFFHFSPANAEGYTGHTLLFTRKRDDYSTNDVELGVDETMSAISQYSYKYIDKIFIRTGKIAGDTHLIEWDSRQSVNNSGKDRNVSVYQSLGLRTEYVPGSGYIFRLKKNHLVNPETYFAHIGRNTQTGETFSRRAYTGWDKKFGNGLDDQHGGQKGYSYDITSPVKELFVESFGVLADSSVQSYKNSLFRTYIALDAAKTTVKSFSHIFWSPDSGILQKNRVYNGEIGLDYVFELRNDENLQKTSLTTKNMSFSANFYDDAEKIYDFSLEAHKIKHVQLVENTDNTYVNTITAPNNEFSTKFNKNAGSATFSYKQGEKTEKIVIKQDSIRLQINTNAFIELDKDKIVLSMASSVLELTAEGMTYNGHPLAFGALADWLSDNKAGLVLSGPPGTPAGLFPAAGIPLSLNITLPPTSSSAFKTKQ